jgi:hypothetical protein
VTSSLILAATALSITAILCLAGLRAWNGWLGLKRLELERLQDAAQDEGEVGVRIELAAVRERLKKLEAIASGVEL